MDNFFSESLVQQLERKKQKVVVEQKKICVSKDGI